MISNNVCSRCKETEFHSQLKVEGEEEDSAKGEQMAANNRAAEGIGSFTLE